MSKTLFLQDDLISMVSTQLYKDEGVLASLFYEIFSQDSDVVSLVDLKKKRSNLNASSVSFVIKVEDGCYFLLKSDVLVLKSFDFFEIFRVLEDHEENLLDFGYHLKNGFVVADPLFLGLKYCSDFLSYSAFLNILDQIYQNPLIRSYQEKGLSLKFLSSRPMELSFIFSEDSKVDENGFFLPPELPYSAFFELIDKNVLLDLDESYNYFIQQILDFERDSSFSHLESSHHRKLCFLTGLSSLCDFRTERSVYEKKVFALSYLSEKLKEEGFFFFDPFQNFKNPLSMAFSFSGLLLMDSDFSSDSKDGDEDFMMSFDFDMFEASRTYKTLHEECVPFFDISLFCEGLTQALSGFFVRSFHDRSKIYLRDCFSSEHWQDILESCEEVGLPETFDKIRTYFDYSSKENVRLFYDFLSEDIEESFLYNFRLELLDKKVLKPTTPPESFFAFLMGARAGFYENLRYKNLSCGPHYILDFSDTTLSSEEYQEASSLREGLNYFNPAITLKCPLESLIEEDEEKIKATVDRFIENFKLLSGDNVVPFSRAFSSRPRVH